MDKIYLSLGSNVGNTIEQMHRALFSLSQLPHTGALMVSGGYITSPVGYEDQEDFLNLCCSLETNLSLPDFHRYTKQMEEDFGRVKTIVNGPRLIDIDLLFHSSGEKLATETLIIPHPRLFQRAFVLAPLTEIFPHSHLLGQDIKKCLQKALETQQIRRLENPLFGNLANHFINGTLSNIVASLIG